MQKKGILGYVAYEGSGCTWGGGGRNGGWRVAWGGVSSDLRVSEVSAGPSVPSEARGVAAISPWARSQSCVSLSHRRDIRGHSGKLFITSETH